MITNIHQDGSCVFSLEAKQMHTAYTEWYNGKLLMAIRP